MRKKISLKQLQKDLKSLRTTKKRHSRFGHPPEYWEMSNPYNQNNKLLQTIVSNKISLKRADNALKQAKNAHEIAEKWNLK
jgi:hypothetical protein